jgi:ankyrin repeat protein
MSSGPTLPGIGAWNERQTVAMKPMAANAVRPSRTVATALVAAVFALGAARMGLLTLHSPMLGYANCGTSVRAASRRLRSVRELRFASISEILVRLSTGWFATLWAIAAGGGAVAIALLLAGRGGPLASLVLLADAACASTFFASLLGDGLIDFARHVHLAQNAWIVACGATLASLVLQLARAPRPGGIPGRSRAGSR